MEAPSRSNAAGGGGRQHQPRVGPGLARGALADEITDTPARIRLLGEPWVLFRSGGVHGRSLPRAYR